MPKGFELCILNILAHFKDLYHIILNRHLHVQSQLKKILEQDSKHALSQKTDRTTYQSSALTCIAFKVSLKQIKLHQVELFLVCFFLFLFKYLSDLYKDKGMLPS